ncbi:hypothetical protein AB4454_11210 [Vibrio artabrorum]|uniref:hypothetical protein n=1 Tax=Vibrio artabrorum TaxID=446374 RepID=UPI0035512513
MSSLKWLKPTKEQAEWLKPYLAKRYPDIDIELSRLAFNTEEYCKNFKKRVDDFWGDKYERKVKIDRMRNNWDKKNSRKKVATASLTISVSPDTKRDFEGLKKFPHLKGCTQAKLLEELLSHYVKSFEQKDKEIRTTTNSNQKQDEKHELKARIDTLEKELEQKNDELEALKEKNFHAENMNKIAQEWDQKKGECSVNMNVVNESEAKSVEVKNNTTQEGVPQIIRTITNSSY